MDVAFSFWHAVKKSNFERKVASNAWCFYGEKQYRKLNPHEKSYLTVVHRTHWKQEAAWEAGASPFC